MQKQLVVTVIGADKPGIVESLADIITQQQGNWLASSMSELAGQFAGILHVSVPDEHYRGLCEALVMLPGLTVSFAEGQVSQEPERQVMLSVTGNDRPGIVHEVASILRQLNINVADLTTGCEPAPHSGAPLFYAHALVALPPGLELGDLIAALESLSDDLVVDIDQAVAE
ncbi:ACT domain-containing protein [Aeromonas encheleia]|uniref:Glycine cleavage system transcriptional repressor n=1 Tax=Aeromonas encheleia TaxID=73010 RepID=A0AAE9MKD2_9GAMM|nr:MULTISPECIES: ACT domain-containing protein [Aeromonas]MBV7413686.1 ACT domain-containing protein [Aeromonas sp. sif2433]MBV7438428.1 ACT domain-containing protein [Aeromonas sp. sif2416]MBV7598859.1 ACT domain-containing protein [Aeromonas sp. sia0103]UNP89710.1 ACT domain-containing protein [Aeromonas encheleia]USV58888.1 ACT domain-containing protein [Aeromonas encheleia]